MPWFSKAAVAPAPDEATDATVSSIQRAGGAWGQPSADFSPEVTRHPSDDAPPAQQSEQHQLQDRPPGAAVLTQQEQALQLQQQQQQQEQHQQQQQQQQQQLQQQQQQLQQLQAPAKPAEPTGPTRWEIWKWKFNIPDARTIFRDICFVILDFLAWWFGAMRFARGVEREMRIRFEDLTRAERTTTDEVRKEKFKNKLEEYQQHLSLVQSSNPKTGAGLPTQTYFKTVRQPKRRNLVALNPALAKDRPILRISVLSARNLRRADWNPIAGSLPPDPYFVCHLLGTKQSYNGKEDVQRKTQDPVWDIAFEFKEYEAGSNLMFQVWDKDLLRDDLLGKVLLETSDFYPNGLHAECFLEQSGLRKGQESYLTVRIEVVFPKAAGWGGDAIRRREAPLGWSGGDFPEDEEEEQPVCQTPPFFVLGQVLVAAILWATQTSTEVDSMAGLEAMAPGKTTLITQRDCREDYRLELWRLLSYQFTHVGFNHIAMNCLLLILIGIPLEGFSGTLLTFFMFNLGVFGGACCWMVSDIHTETVGMSGGCYSLIGITLGSLVMNKDENKYFYTSVLLLLFLLAVDLIQASLGNHTNISNSAHFGGVCAGFLAALVFGRNMKVSQAEKKLSAFALVLGILIAAGCLLWGGTHEVPADIFDQAGYCWWRQVVSPALFNNTVSHCVQCDSEGCVDKWEAFISSSACSGGTLTSCQLATVSLSDCSSTLGGWSTVAPR